MLIDLIRPRQAVLAAKIAFLFAPTVPDAVDVLEIKAAAAAGF